MRISVGTFYDDGKGFPTIGWGANLRAGIYPKDKIADLLCGHPIGKEQAYEFLGHGIRAAEGTLDQKAPNWRSFTDSQQRALVELAFLFSPQGLSGIDGFLPAIEAGDLALAGEKLMASQWAKGIKTQHDEAVRTKNYAPWKTRPQILAEQLGWVPR